MIQDVVSIRDRAANVFSRPWYVPSLPMAIRAFRDEVNRVDANNEMNRHPEDFDLYHLGTYDDATGTFTNCEHPRQVAIGKDMVKST